MRLTCPARLSVLVAVGCGSQSKQAASPAQAEGEVRSLLASYKRALETDNAARICDDLSRSVQRQVISEVRRTVPVTSCEQVMQLLIHTNPSLLRKITRETTGWAIHVTGDRASVITSRGDKTLTSGVTREGGAWKLSEAPR